MKISIVTVCFNSELTIKRTIESVLSQKGVNIEYIIVDGKSKDKTVDIAETYREAFSTKGYEYMIISEPDKGIYDAMNKGIAKSSGEIIGILNSDDEYASNDVLFTVVEEFKKTNYDSCYGNLLYVKSDGDRKVPFRYWKSGAPKTFRYGWMPPHPTFFVKKIIYDKYGVFSLDFGTAADYELMLRFLERNKITTSWVDKLFIYMEAGGASGRNFDAYKKSHMNDLKAWKKNNLKPILGFAWLKKIRKLPQFFKAKCIKL